MGETIQTILRRSFGAFVARHRQPLHIHRSARAMMECRTAALGGHAEVCENGHLEGVWYNSCRHRACPQCSFLEIEEWLSKKRDLLLGCSHHHVVFTLPHELLALWRWNRRRMADLLLRCAAETLQELLADPRYLGGCPGLLVALHTWSRTLQLHPHAHCLVSAGGANKQGLWQEARRSFLLPGRVVCKKFRGKYLSWLSEHLAAGKLVVPSDMTLQQVQALLLRSARKKWNVRVGERYRQGAGVATYLARYARGGPLKNRRISSTFPSLASIGSEPMVSITRTGERLSKLAGGRSASPQPRTRRFAAKSLFDHRKRCRAAPPVVRLWLGDPSLAAALLHALSGTSRHDGLLSDLLLVSNVVC